MPETEFDYTIYKPFDRHFRLLYTDFDPVTHIAKIAIEAGRVLENVRTRVAVAFNAGSTLIVGEAADTDSFVAATMLNPTVLNSVKNSNQGGVEDQVSGVTVYVANAEGKYFPTGGVLLFTMNQALTAGELQVDLRYSGYRPVMRGMVDHQTPTYTKPDMKSVVVP